VAEEPPAADDGASEVGGAGSGGAGWAVTVFAVAGCSVKVLVDVQVERQRVLVDIPPGT
jgi:hypothetical protein